MWEEIERRIHDAASWRPALDACPETTGVQIERPGLEAGEPWCVTQLAGLQFTPRTPPAWTTPLPARRPATDWV